MITKISKVCLENGVPVLKEITQQDIVLNQESVIAIDGSTSNSGLAILNKSTGAMCACIAATRENKEDPVRYKINLKRFIAGLLREHRNITYVYYEEPIIEYASAVANLMMLRSMVTELKIENEPEFDYVGNSEVNNKKWKRVFMEPTKLPDKSEDQKRVVRERLLMYMPMLEGITQDEVDAIAMGFAAIKMTLAGYAENELESKKKAKPFQYNIEFVGADNENTAIEDFFASDIRVPTSVLNNGLRYVEIGPRANFDKTVYNEMSDEDKLLVIGFNSDKHCDLILKHKIGPLSATYSMLYAFVWRKARKR